MVGDGTNMMVSTKWKTCTTHNARRLRVLRILVGMLDPCAQVGRELRTAHQQMDTKPGYTSSQG